MNRDSVGSHYVETGEGSPVGYQENGRNAKMSSVIGMVRGSGEAKTEDCA